MAYTRIETVLRVIRLAEVGGETVEQTTHLPVASYSNDNEVLHLDAVEYGNENCYIVLRQTKVVGTTVYVTLHPVFPVELLKAVPQVEDRIYPMFPTEEENDNIFAQYVERLDRENEKIPVSCSSQVVGGSTLILQLTYDSGAKMELYSSANLYTNIEEIKANNIKRRAVALLQQDYTEEDFDAMCKQLAVML